MQGHWFVQCAGIWTQWLGSGATKPIAGKPTKACQNGRGIWLYNAGIRQGSSGYFDWSDEWVMQPHSTAKYAVLILYLMEMRFT